MRIRLLSSAVAILAIGAITGIQAYVLNGPKWGTSQVPYYINPANLDVSETAATAAVQAGLATWGSQSNASFSFYYMGRTSGTSLANNGKNEIFFRNASSGSTAAQTYWWYDGSNHLIDADIMFYDGGFKFFTGSSGCSGGLYIEDVAAHESGHALGLGHSSVATATMYPSMGWCSMSLRTLDSDDLAGVEKLYPAAGGTTTTTTNTAPTVSITAPANNSSFAAGATITFSGSASDREDGALSSSIIWTSSINGQLGVGASISKSLSSGTHKITAKVTDKAGVSATASIVVNVATAVSTTTTTTVRLSATGVKVKGVESVNLAWVGATSTSIDIYRNGTRVLTTANDGAQTDFLNKKGAGTYTYKVCQAGTSTCSSSVTVTF